MAGQIVQSNAVIFQIVDPAKLWIEALSFQALRDVKDASAKTAAGNALTIAFKRLGLRRPQPVDPGAFRQWRKAPTACAPASSSRCSRRPATARKASRCRAARVIRAANGQDFVYEHVSAERFEARPVRIEPLDGERVLIAAGIDAGQRIVVQGAELLDHVR